MVGPAKRPAGFLSEFVQGLPRLIHLGTVDGLKENALWVQQWARFADAKEVQWRVAKILDGCAGSEGASGVRPICRARHPLILS
jgi:hypothetical protein